MIQLIQTVVLFASIILMVMFIIAGHMLISRCKHRMGDYMILCFLVCIVVLAGDAFWILLSN